MSFQSNEQIICDHEQCREKILNKIKGMKIDFIENISTNQIDDQQGWKIILFMSEKLSDKLVLLFNKQEIHSIIQNFIQQNQTKQTFQDLFSREKKQDFIDKEQLWKIFIKMCEDAIILLSKSKQERQKYLSNLI